jgi:replicative DNA helicase
MEKQNLILEYNLLAMLVDGSQETRDLIFDQTGKDLFYNNLNQALYVKMQELYNDNKDFDMVYISGLSEFKYEYMAELMGHYKSAGSAETVIHDLKQLYKRRRLETLIKTIDYAEIDETLNRLQNEMFLLSTDKKENDFNFGEEFAGVIEKIQSGINGVRMNGYPWGLPTLDDYTGGLENGKCYVVGALKKTGKTKFIIYVINHLLKNKIPVYFISLEMGSSYVIEWILSNFFKIDSSHFGKSRFLQSDLDRIIQSAGSIVKLPLDVCKEQHLNLINVRNKIRKSFRKFGKGVVFLDYLQKMDIDNSNGRAYGVQQTVSRLADFSREFDFPFVIISQLKNEAERKERPDLSDLKESGGIAEGVDSIILLNNLERAGKENENKYNFEVIVDAQRNGRSGIINTYSDLSIGSFMEVK